MRLALPSGGCTHPLGLKEDMNASLTDVTAVWMKMRWFYKPPSSPRMTSALEPNISTVGLFSLIEGGSSAHSCNRA